MATRGVSTEKATDVEATPYKEQLPFMGHSKRYYGFVSGTGAGKTFAGVYRLWLNVQLWNPNSMGAILVPDKSQFVDNVKPIMEDFGLINEGTAAGWEYKSVYTAEPGLITPNGQRILILSADNQRQIGRLKGKNLGFIWMDEEAEIPPRARQIADQRLRVGNYPNLFITTTPDGKNHTYDFFDGDVAADKRTYGEGMIYETDNRLAVVGVPPEANPAMREEDIAAIRQSLPDQIVQQEIEGLFVEVGSGVYSKESFSFVDPDEIKDSYELTYALGVDPAVKADSTGAQASDSDYWAVTLCAIHRVQNQIYAVDQRRNRGMSLKEGTEWVAEIASNVPDPNLYVESNQSQRWLAQELADYGLSVTQVQTGRNKEDKLTAMSIPLTNGVVKFVCHERDEQLGYDPRWSKLIDEALAFPEGSHDDLLDSLNIVLDNANISRTMSLSADMYGRDNE